MVSVPRLGWLIAFAGCSTACAKRDRDSAALRVAGLVLQADEAWSERGDAGFDPVDAALQQAWAAAATDPEVGWRLVRLRCAQGLADPDPRGAMYQFAEARALGMECLRNAPGFTEILVEDGWEGALLDLDPATASCAAWLSLSWARWIALHGGRAAAIDIPVVERIAAAAEAEAPADHVDEAFWARGLLAAVRPTWDGRDLDRAEALLERAILGAPRHLPRQVDLLTLVLGPKGEVDRAEALRAAILAAEARTPEDVRAREQVRVDPDASGEPGEAPPAR